MVHSIRTAADTFSVVVQGPRVKQQSFRVRNGSIVAQEGEPGPNLARIRSVRTSSDRVGEIAELAHRLGLIDSVRI
jgi:hypothetical protein